MGLAPGRALKRPEKEDREGARARGPDIVPIQGRPLARYRPRNRAGRCSGLLRRCAAMSAYEIERPLWRRFRPRYLRRAAWHVQRGGHAVMVPEVGPIEMILAIDKNDKKARI